MQKGDTFVLSLFPSPPLEHISQRILAGGGVSYTRFMRPQEAQRAAGLTPQQLGMVTGSVRVSTVNPTL